MLYNQFTVANDLETVDSVISALYESTRHTKENPQDWDRFRTLFVPNAVLVQAASNTYFIYEYGLEDYIAEAEYYRDRDPSAEWFQTEVARDIRQLDDTAHVFSIYSYGGTGTERTHPIRGTSSFHLVKEESHTFPTGPVEHRWQITSWHWTADVPNLGTSL